VERREKLTRARRWERQDEDEVYSAKQLNRDIVNPDQARTGTRGTTGAALTAQDYPRSLLAYNPSSWTT